MPIKIRVNLSTENEVKNFFGDDIHALFFKLLKEDIAYTLHTNYKDKPFSLWYKLNKNGLTLYISFLIDDIAKEFLSSFLIGEETFKFMNIKFRKILNLKVEKKNIKSFSTIYEESTSNNTAKLSFVTPTTFKKGKYDYPIPEPKLIFKSLMRKWNKFADFKPHIDLRETFEKRIIVSGYNLKTKKVFFRNLGKVVGFVGDITMEFQEDNEEILKWLNALLVFGEFSGVGRKTTMGMGQIKILY